MPKQPSTGVSPLCRPESSFRVSIPQFHLDEVLVWCIRSSVVNKWVLYANPFLRFEQESGFLPFRKPSNNVVNYGYRTLGRHLETGPKELQRQPLGWRRRLL